MSGPPPLRPLKNRYEIQSTRKANFEVEPRQLQGNLYPLNTFLISVGTLESLLGRYGRVFGVEFVKKELKIAIFAVFSLYMAKYAKKQRFWSLLGGIVRKNSARSDQVVSQECLTISAMDSQGIVYLVTSVDYLHNSSFWRSEFHTDFSHVLPVFRGGGIPTFPIIIG